MDHDSVNSSFEYGQTLLVLVGNMSRVPWSSGVGKRGSGQVSLRGI